MFSRAGGVISSRGDIGIAICVHISPFTSYHITSTKQPIANLNPSQNTFIDGLKRGKRHFVKTGSFNPLVTSEKPNFHLAKIVLALLTFDYGS